MNKVTWQWKRAWELSGLPTQNYFPSGDGKRVMEAFASYIAEHEDPPVDPLLVEAREIVGEFASRRGWGSYSARYRAGTHDSHSVIEVALEALKRGIEIGKAA